MTRPVANKRIWDRYEWAGDTGHAGAGQALRADADRAREPRHWNEGSLIFEHGDAEGPKELPTREMAMGDNALTGGGSNPGGGERWASDRAA